MNKLLLLTLTLSSWLSVAAQSTPEIRGTLLIRIAEIRNARDSARFATAKSRPTPSSAFLYE